MIGSFTIRPATRDDLPELVRLVRGLAEYERLAHRFTATEADYDTLLFAPDHVADAILAETPGRPPVGVALYNRTVNTFQGRMGLCRTAGGAAPLHVVARHDVFNR